MEVVKQFFNSVKDVASTRKFWVVVLGAALDAAVAFVADVPELSGAIKLLTALGVWRVPNK